MFTIPPEALDQMRLHLAILVFVNPTSLSPELPSRLYYIIHYGVLERARAFPFDPFER